MNMTYIEEAWEASKKISVFYEDKKYTDKDGVVWLGIEGDISDDYHWLREDTLVSMPSADMTKKMINEFHGWDETPVEDPYEYSVQFTIKGRKYPVSHWMGKEAAEEWLGEIHSGLNAKYGPWSKTLVKRRKAGKVEDV